MYGRVRGFASSGVLAMLLSTGIAIVPNASARAQGLLDFLFGPRRPAPEQAAPAPGYAPQRVAPGDAHRSADRVNPVPGPRRGSRMAYCVRLCDGRYFPVQPHPSVSSAAQCSAFCPASATKIFSGSGIEHAVAADGRRYAGLPNAFVYRKQIVADCTCDGQTTGVAQQPVAEDPTLRSGDIVATNSGLAVYRGKNAQQHAILTPIDEANISKSLRDRLMDVKVAPQLPQPAPADDEPEAPPPDLSRQVSAR